MIRALSIAGLVALVAACQPWYRDAERAGQRAGDQKQADKLISDANAARDRGDHAGAAVLLRRAILDVPGQSADTYLSLARESFAAGDIAGGRAATRRGMELWPTDARFGTVLVEQKLADDLVALAIDEAKYSSFDAAAGDSSLAPQLDALQRASRADHADTAAGELALWLEHYGVPDHQLLRATRDSVADRIKRDAESTPSLAGLATAADRADAELAAGHVARALALYSEVYRLLPTSVLDAHFASFAKAAQQATDPEAIDGGAYTLAVQGDTDAAAGHLGLAIHSYRKAVARAPWWADARRNLASLYDSAGMPDMATAERAFADRLSR
ncbi:MAG TPA: hypothetical protein VL326_27980 [Kofleriaceae bacterium]|nr:hypothetical protein [Kofleriaceae bacterium]